jgi:hypothetical protein
MFQYAIRFVKPLPRLAFGVVFDAGHGILARAQREKYRQWPTHDS